MKKIWIIFSVTLCLAMTSPVYAETPAVMDIITKMKKVQESALEMAQKIDIVIKNDDEVVSRLMAGKAQKRLPTGKHVLLVILEPDMLKGFAYLYKEKDDMTVDRWIYPPVINRIRKIVEPWNAYDSFLNTDFTYADFGLVDTKGEYKLLGEEKIENTETYKVEKIPENTIRYYSKIIIWISKETYLPLRQDFYDIANRLYKRQLFENIVMVSKTPVPNKITMMNLQTKGSTVLTVKELTTGLDLPDDIFVPERLAYSSTCPIWERVCYPSEMIRKK